MAWNHLKTLTITGLLTLSAGVFEMQINSGKILAQDIDIFRNPDVDIMTNPRPQNSIPTPNTGSARRTCPLTGNWEFSSATDFGYSPNSGFFDGGPAYTAPVQIQEDGDKLIISGFYQNSSGLGEGLRTGEKVSINLPLRFGTGQLTADITQSGSGITGQISFSDGKPGHNQVTIPFKIQRVQPYPKSPPSSGLICGGW